MENFEVDSKYFRSYEDAEIHKLMLQDKPRTESYRDAIFKNSESVFKDKVVLDVGAGTGILSLFAADAGAKRVYAVEASEISTVLRKIVDRNRKSSVITVLSGNVESVDLPEKVDVLISEWMGFYLVHESMLRSVIRARDKHLAEFGIVFPSHARLYAAPIETTEQATVESFWNRNIYGYDMSPMMEFSKTEAFQPDIKCIDSSQLLSEPRLIIEWDLRWITEVEIESFSKRHFMSVSRSGNFRAVCLWFDVDFDPYPYETDSAKVDSVVTLSTGPSAPMTHWKQTLIVLERDIDVEIDEIIGWNLEFRQCSENSRQYAIRLEMLDPSQDEHPVPCDCMTAKCALIKALMEKEDDENLE